MGVRRLSIVILSLALLAMPDIQPGMPGAQAQDLPLDIVVLIDQSGSMFVEASGESDPLGLRFDAASMLMDLLDSQDRIGIIAFSGTARTLVRSELIPLNSAQDRQLLKDEIKVEKADPQGGGTNYGPALDQAWSLLETPSGNRRAVIFLTDGQPSDLKKDTQLSDRLSSFREQGIPVYLLWLQNKLTEARTDRLMEVVSEAFHATGPVPVQIKNPEDIAQAFARVITELRPGTYLDVLEPIPDKRGTRRFEVKAGSEQVVKTAKFVFVSTSKRNRFSASLLGSPPGNAGVSTSTGDSYSVVTLTTDDNRSLTGSWSFTANADDATGFAFVKSDLELDLRYPGSQDMASSRAVLSGEKLLIGVSVLGGGTAISTLDAWIESEQCQDEGKKQSSAGYELEREGLSEDGKVFWRTIGDVSTDTDWLAVHVQQGQLDSPLRLHRCFSVRMISGDPDLLKIIKPTDVDTLTDGGIPIQLGLADSVTWQGATAYVQAPSGQVSAVHLDVANPTAASPAVTEPGTYKIRVVAEGEVAGNSVALYRETTYTPEDFPDYVPKIDLGSVEQLGQKFNANIPVEGLFIGQDMNLRFSPVGVYDANAQRVENLVEVVICDQPTIQPGSANCAVQVAPSDALPAGSYVVEVLLEQGDPAEEVGKVNLMFERPPSRLVLLESSYEMGMLEAGSDVLTTTLAFEPVLWQEDNALQRDVQINELIHQPDKTSAETSLLSARLVPEGVGSFRYNLVLQPARELEPGAYQARVKVNPAAVGALSVEPAEFLLNFAIPRPGVVLKFDRDLARPAAWGNLFWLPSFLQELLTREVYVPVVASTYHITGTPTLDLPEVVALSPGPDNEALDPASIVPIEWRSEGAVKGKVNQYQYTLVLRVAGDLPAGRRTVRLRMLPPISEPQEKEVTVRVLGNSRLWWCGGCPAVAVILGLVLILQVRKVRRREFTGVLENRTVGLRLDLRPWRKYQELGMTRDGEQFGVSATVDPKAPRIRCISRDEIQITYQDKQARLVRGAVNRDPWTYK